MQYVHVHVHQWCTPHVRMGDTRTRHTYQQSHSPLYVSVQLISIQFSTFCPHFRVFCNNGAILGNGNARFRISEKIRTFWWFLHHFWWGVIFEKRRDFSNISRFSQQPCHIRQRKCQIWIQGKISHVLIPFRKNLRADHSCLQDVCSKFKDRSQLSARYL